MGGSQKTYGVAALSAIAGIVFTASAAVVAFGRGEGARDAKIQQQGAALEAGAVRATADETRIGNVEREVSGISAKLDEHGKYLERIDRKLDRLAGGK